MTRRLPILRLAVVSAAVMVLLPALAVELLQGDAGFPAVLALFFVADPLFCLLAGRWCARQRPPLLWGPLLPAGLFLAGAWLAFEPGEPAFFQYALGYLVLGWLGYGAARLLDRQ